MFQPQDTVASDGETEPGTAKTLTGTPGRSGSCRGEEDSEDPSPEGLSRHLSAAACLCLEPGPRHVQHIWSPTPAEAPGGPRPGAAPPEPPPAGGLLPGPLCRLSPSPVSRVPSKEVSGPRGDSRPGLPGRELAPSLRRGCSMSPGFFPSSLPRLVWAPAMSTRAGSSSLFSRTPPLRSGGAPLGLEG